MVSSCNAIQITHKTVQYLCLPKEHNCISFDIIKAKHHCNKKDYSKVFHNNNQMCNSIFKMIFTSPQYLYMTGIHINKNTN